MAVDKATGSKSARGQQARERLALALERRRQGRTYAEIAEELGITAQAVHKLVSKALTELANQSRDQVDQLRALEAERLDTAQAGIWDSVKAGELDAVYAFVRISERRSKLLGLDQPERKDLTSGGVPFKVYVGFDPDGADEELSISPVEKNEEDRAA